MADSKNSLADAVKAALDKTGSKTDAKTPVIQTIESESLKQSSKSGTL